MITIEYYYCLNSGATAFNSICFVLETPSVYPITLPLTLVEDVLTRYEERLICAADLGYPGGNGRVLKLEHKLAGETDFEAFNLASPEKTASEGSCQLNTTISFRSLTFTRSYNSTVLRCSVYEDNSSIFPLAISEEVTLLLLESKYN